MAQKAMDGGGVLVVNRPGVICRLPTALKRTRHTPENSDNEGGFHAGESL